jgi:hypothetical protein
MAEQRLTMQGHDNLAHREVGRYSIAWAAEFHGRFGLSRDEFGVAGCIATMAVIDVLQARPGATNSDPCALLAMPNGQLVLTGPVSESIGSFDPSKIVCLVGPSSYVERLATRISKVIQ